MLSPLALSLHIELTSPTDCKCIYKDCIASLRRFLKLSLYHSIVNITEFHLDSDYDLCTYIASNQDLLLPTAETQWDYAALHPATINKLYAYSSSAL